MLIGENDCLACHKVAEKSVGPNYTEIAARYAGDGDAREMLAGKIIAGGGGNWGENVMSAHPELAKDDALAMVRYILSLSDKKAAGLPLRGDYAVQLPDDDAGTGVYILRAAYQDKGAQGLPGLTSEKTVVLRNANLNVFGFDTYEKVRKMTFGGRNLLLPDAPGAYMVLKDVSLAGVEALNVTAMAPKPQVNAIGGAVELHLGAPDGPLVGKSDYLEATEQFNPNAAPAAPLHIPVTTPAGTDPAGLQDLYLVFTHPTETQGMPMVVTGFQVQLAPEQVLK